ncbi:unnamed protein product [Orchesella dallaii]|uniref:glutathione transferase n=1 Tax=Orchesella dallaii TaxID=48710 RepID=A0ABP1R8Y4_9HEXA
MVVTLTYFNGRGLAEPIRIILAYGGEKFEEVRVPIVFPPSLPEEVRNKCTWGQVPLVEFEGKKLSQSLAITRYFARKHNLVPKDDFEAALCDEYVDACRDFMNLWTPIVHLIAKKEEEGLKEKKDEVQTISKQKFLNVFNSIVEKNGGKRLVGKSITWADIYLTHALQNIEMITGLSLVSEFPALKELMNEVLNVPSIKSWIEKRPKTPL